MAPRPHTDAIERELKALLGPEGVLPGTTARYLTDATESRNIKGRADAVALPADAAQVAETVRWCYDHDVAIVPRGGGSGFTGGAVPSEGGVVVSLERLNGPPRLDPELWRSHAPAGITTAELRRRARESGLLYPPDPGAAEQSQLGGNIATNAGGPHTFKYGVTGTWITGLEVVLAGGELITVGGPVRKDVAGYDLKSLIVGSEGTLGIVTAAWCRLIPAPEAQLPVLAFYPDTETGCAAVAAVLASGLQPAALEYLDEETVATAIRGFPGPAPERPGFMLIAEADGSQAEAGRLREELIDALSTGAAATHAPVERSEIRELWRWRSGVSLTVIAARGGKVSEDIVVPLDRLAEAIAAIREIGRRHRLPACSWGHAGDGNLHATFLIDPADAGEGKRSEAAAEDLFELAVDLGGSVSGEHGLGIVKRGALARQWSEPALAAHAAIKRVFDPKGLLNPGTKLAR